MPRRDYSFNIWDDYAMRNEEKPDPKTFNLVSPVGLCYLSVCTNETDTAKIEMWANLNHPTNIRSQWAISKSTHFKDGHTNPCVCEQNDERKHYLLEC